MEISETFINQLFHSCFIIPDFLVIVYGNHFLLGYFLSSDSAYGCINAKNQNYVRHHSTALEFTWSIM